MEKWSREHLTLSLFNYEVWKCLEQTSHIHYRFLDRFGVSAYFSGPLTQMTKHHYAARSSDRVAFRGRPWSVGTVPTVGHQRFDGAPWQVSFSSTGSGIHEVGSWLVIWSSIRLKGQQIWTQCLFEGSFVMLNICLIICKPCARETKGRRL